MAKQQIRSERVPPPAGSYSQAITAPASGRMVFVSGMTARRADGTLAGIGDIEAQTRQVCENIKAALEAAGASMDDVCRLDIYLRNIGDRQRFNKVRAEYWQAAPPASTLVEVSKLASPEYLVEITAFAVTSG
jgi:2-iminobutanoate/2-iminopropanoate deaminase